MELGCCEAILNVFRKTNKKRMICWYLGEGMRTNAMLCFFYMLFHLILIVYNPIMQNINRKITKRLQELRIVWDFAYFAYVTSLTTSLTFIITTSLTLILSHYPLSHGSESVPQAVIVSFQSTISSVLGRVI